MVRAITLRLRRAVLSTMYFLASKSLISPAKRVGRPLTSKVVTGLMPERPVASDCQNVSGVEPTDVSTPRPVRTARRDEADMKPPGEDEHASSRSSLLWLRHQSFEEAAHFAVEDKVVFAEDLFRAV